MAGLATLIKLAEHRADEAMLAWRQLNAQRDDAKNKLVLLQKHGESYRDLMRIGLQHGVSAASIVAHIGFMAQIESVSIRQQSELGQLEEACARQWGELVSARREKRMYEILGKRIAARGEAALCRRQQVETGEMLVRAAQPSAAISRGWISDE